MDYFSVKETAEHFGLSTRRVQKLCENNRIHGCKMVSGVWLIPTNAQKPNDERTVESPMNNNCISLKELCNTLSISIATGRNWIKLGKLKPKYTERKTPYFSKAYVKKIKSEIRSGKISALKNRRNKKYITGNSLYSEYVSDKCKNADTIYKLLRIAKTANIAFTLETIQFLVADCAIHLLAKKNNEIFKNESFLLLKFLRGEIKLAKYSELINALISSPQIAIEFCKKHPEFFNFDYIYEPGEDILGLIYISCKNIGKRKATGSYFTPTKIVKNLISRLNLTSGEKVLDPCCGTGNFLLQLPSTVSFKTVYGNDIDPISVKITRLNMALRFDNLSIASITEHITNKDFLTDYKEKDFQFIIGNPPWGYEFSEKEKSILKKRYKVASETSLESYDVFIESSLNALSVNGQLSYVLPEAILNVRAHEGIRRIIMQHNTIKYLEFLGNAFDGVQCPSIILQLLHDGHMLTTKGMVVSSSDHTTTIGIERRVTSENFSFLTSDDEYTILENLRNNLSVKYLLGNADFALGIVTGNNKKYISPQKTNNNEIVLKGADICKYHIKSANSYIVFKPEHFQQHAPVEMYRSPEKLLYRFISKQLVFAYDNRQTLSLNSCNIVIPKLAGFKTKYILAILNSRVAQFIFEKEFNSVKVLRSHIENIPIPLIDVDRQNSIITYVDELIGIRALDEAQSIYDDLDQLVMDAFSLTKTEQTIIKKALCSNNLFLV